MKEQTIYRDAKTGQIVSQDYADENPETTYKSEVQQLDPEDIERALEIVNDGRIEQRNGTIKLPERFYSPDQLIAIGEMLHSKVVDESD